LAPVPVRGLCLYPAFDQSVAQQAAEELVNLRVLRLRPELANLDLDARRGRPTLGQGFEDAGTVAHGSTCCFSTHSPNARPNATAHANGHNTAQRMLLARLGS